MAPVLERQHPRHTEFVVAGCRRLALVREIGLDLFVVALQVIGGASRPCRGRLGDRVPFIVEGFAAEGELKAARPNAAGQEKRRPGVKAVALPSDERTVEVIVGGTQPCTVDR